MASLQSRNFRLGDGPELGTIRLVRIFFTRPTLPPEHRVSISYRSPFRVDKPLSAVLREWSDEEGVPQFHAISLFGSGGSGPFGRVALYEPEDFVAAEVSLSRGTVHWFVGAMGRRLA